VPPSAAERAQTGSRPVCFDAVDGFVETPVYWREDLLAGDEIVGPAIFEEFGSTVPLHPRIQGSSRQRRQHHHHPHQRSGGQQMTTTVETSTVDSGSMLRTDPLTGQELADYIAASPINPAGLPTAYEHGNRLTAPGSRVDPIIVEIVEGTLASVEMEVETSISRTSRSPMIRDAHDFRAGIHDRQLRKLTGRSYSALVHPVVRDFPIEEMREGDVFFHNDVYESEGGIGHLPDMCVTVPVFAEGEVVCFVQGLRPPRRHRRGLPRIDALGGDERLRRGPHDSADQAVV
jgi:hypothetical protein